MITVSQAIENINQVTRSLNSIKIDVSDGLNKILAETVYSPIHMPPFNQSAMDGYALGDVTSESYQLIGEVKAGDNPENLSLSKGQAVRIFTGGVVPNGAITVAQQEIVERSDNTIHLTTSIVENINIRPKGEQIIEGQLALEKGTLITPATIGFLYGIGIDKICVYSSPKIAIIATGSELVSPGQKLTLGQIYESNSFALKAAIETLGVEASIISVKDNYEITRDAIKQALENNDMVLTSGGISVGDYDFVGDAFQEVGVKEHFYKVQQKPGKPLFFGQKDDTAVFGLPGNPASALSCFYVYVMPTIKKMMGHTDSFDERENATLTSSYARKGSFTHFLKAHIKDNKVTVLNAQSSAMLSSFAAANCLACFPGEQENWNAGDTIQVIRID